jgi:hypothetical protein
MLHAVILRKIQPRMNTNEETQIRVYSCPLAVRKIERNSAAQPFGEADEFVGDLFDSPGDVFIADALAVEGI